MGQLSSIATSVANIDKENITAEELLEMVSDAITDYGVSLREAFKQVDKDGNGTITVDELTDVLRELGFPVDSVLKDDLYAILDKNGDGRVSYGEFVKTVGSRDYSRSKKLGRQLSSEDLAHNYKDQVRLPNDLTNEEALLRIRGTLMDDLRSLKKIFRKFDADNSGTVTKDEFHKALEAMKFVIEPAMSARLFAAFDKDFDGSVRYNEFIRVIQHGQFVADPAAASSKTVSINPRQPHDVPGDMSVEDFLTMVRDRIIDGGSSLRATFKKYDKSRDGKLQRDELLAGMREYGYALPPATADRLWAIFDKDNSGDVAYHEVVKTVMSRDYSHAPRNDGNSVSLEEARGDGPTVALVNSHILHNAELLLRIRNHLELRSPDDVPVAEWLGTNMASFKGVDNADDAKLGPQDVRDFFQKLGIDADLELAQRVVRMLDSHPRDGFLGFGELKNLLADSSKFCPEVPDDDCVEDSE